MESWTCKYCNTSKTLKNKFTKSGHHAQCEAFQEWKTQTLNKEFLQKEYIENGKSCRQIADELNLASVTIVWKAIMFHDIPKRNISQSKLMEKCKQRRMETCIENFGYEHNFSKNSPSRLKWEERLLIEENITNVFQREKVKEKVIEFKRNSNSHVYGSRISKPHIKIANYLKSLNIDIKLEYKIKIEQCNYYFDILIENTNKLIEINGDYWHANPKYYQKNSIIKRFGYVETALTVWQRDNIKNNYAKNLGYKILILWEKDINKNFELIKKKIEKYLND